jgi:two-component system OmpR family sensor kinase
VIVEDGEDLTVHVDADLLDRALGNAVDNAVRYGAGTITLAARAAGGLAVLTVHDQGKGMAAEFLPHAAERFSQHETSRSGRGAGLGLSLVDAIVTAHSGQLRICSNGTHHFQPTPRPDLTRVPCTHAAAGTTITILLAHATQTSDRETDRQGMRRRSPAEG